MERVRAPRQRHAPRMPMYMVLPRRLRAGLMSAVYSQVLLTRGADAAGGPDAATLMGVDAPRVVNLVPSFQVASQGRGRSQGAPTHMAASWLRVLAKGAKR